MFRIRWRSFKLTLLFSDKLTLLSEVCRDGFSFQVAESASFSKEVSGFSDLRLDIVEARRSNRVGEDGGVLFGGKVRSCCGPCFRR